MINYSMQLFGSKKKSELIREDSLKIGGKTFNKFVYLETRYDCRASIGQKGIHIRLSKFMTEAERRQQEIELTDWAKSYISKHHLQDKPPLNRNYRDGDYLKVMGKEFLIRVLAEPQKDSSRGELKNNVITLHISVGMSEKQEQKHKTYLVSKLIGNEFQPAIAQRISELNEIHFKKTIKKLRIRDNITNWGSCSHTGDITISARLLFAPPEVIDYILIHELAHLVELNHSNRFWKIVEKAMPGYELAEGWLRKNGDQCVF